MGMSSMVRLAVSSDWPELCRKQPRHLAHRTRRHLAANFDHHQRLLRNYFSDTFDVSDRLAMTAGGRCNFARLTLEDQTGEDPFLNGSHTFQRFNPMGGATYRLAKGLSFYGICRSQPCPRRQRSLRAPIRKTHALSRVSLQVIRRYSRLSRGRWRRDFAVKCFRHSQKSKSIGALAYFEP